MPNPKRTMNEDSANVVRRYMMAPQPPYIEGLFYDRFSSNLEDYGVIGEFQNFYKSAYGSGAFGMTNYEECMIKMCGEKLLGQNPKYYNDGGSSKTN